MYKLHFIGYYGHYFAVQAEVCFFIIAVDTSLFYI